MLNIVTGVSGAGKSLALRTFEDLGFEVIDNIPLLLIDAVLDLKAKEFKTAIGIDVRSRNFSTEEFLKLIKRLKENHDFETNILFIDCNDNIIKKRYTETRRKHPLTKNMQLSDALKSERLILQPVKNVSDIIIDTSEITGHAFKRIVENKFSFGSSQKLLLTTMSFAYKKGIPQEADLVFDVRFLRNPHYDENLRHKTGNDKDVRDYVKVDKDYVAFWEGLKSLFSLMIPRYVEEGKSYLTIAFGCTGGKHRSVTFANETAEFLQTKGYKVDVIHREIEK